MPGEGDQNINGVSGHCTPLSKAVPPVRSGGRPSSHKALKLINRQTGRAASPLAQGPCHGVQWADRRLVRVFSTRPRRQREEHGAGNIRKARARSAVRGLALGAVGGTILLKPAHPRGVSRRAPAAERTTRFRFGRHPPAIAAVRWGLRVERLIRSNLLSGGCGSGGSSPSVVQLRVGGRGEFGKQGRTAPACMGTM